MAKGGLLGPKNKMLGIKIKQANSERKWNFYIQGSVDLRGISQYLRLPQLYDSCPEGVVGATFTANLQVMEENEHGFSLCTSF